MNLKKRLLRTYLIGFILTTNSIYAHHAMEYIEIESYSTAQKGEFGFHLHYDYMTENTSNPLLDHWEMTPGISYGILDRLMFDVHTHFAKFGKEHTIAEEQLKMTSDTTSAFMEAIAFSLQYRLLHDFPVKIAIAFTYEEPFALAKKLLDSQRVFEGKLIISREFPGHVDLTANFTFGKDGTENTASWAIGSKTPLSRDPHGISGGIELMGDYEGAFSVLPGIYFPISENILCKTGLEVGNNNYRRANFTLMYRF